MRRHRRESVITALRRELQRLAEIDANDITDDDVAEVEAQVGCAAAAWDFISPKTIIAAAIRVIAAK